MASPPPSKNPRFGVKPTPSDALPAVFISGPAKFVVPHSLNDGFSFENCIFTRAMLGERDAVRRSLEMAKEKPVSRQARHDLAISQEMQQLKHEDFVEEKKRQQLRQNSVELRELTEHLKLAAISKDLSEHLGDFYKTRLQIERSKDESRRQVEFERQQFLCEVREKQLALKEQQRKLSDTLTLQIKQNQDRRQQEAFQTKVDLQIRLAMQQQIEAEDRAKQLHQEQKKIQKRQEMDRCLEEKNAYRALKNRQSEAELKKLTESQINMDERKHELQQKRLELMRKHEEISNLLGHQVSKIKADKHQRETLLLDLLESEYNAKREELSRQQLQHDTLLRKQTKEELDSYRRMVVQRNMENNERKRQELAIRQANSLQKQEEIDREQRVAAHLKRKDHGNVLLSMIKDNQLKRAEAMAEDVQFYNMKTKVDKEVRERIDQERLAMLKSVPTSVLRFLPNQVLSDADRKKFGVEQRKKKGAGDS